MGIIIIVLSSLVLALIIRYEQLNNRVQRLKIQVDACWDYRPKVSIEAYSMETWGKGTVINYPYKGKWMSFPVRENNLGVLILGKMLGAEYKHIPDYHTISHEDLKRLGYTVHHIEQLWNR